METNFEYYAFISYKREDEKWAMWLQNRLEKYRLPSAIRKEIPRLPKQIRPVFRDKTDLGAGALTDNLVSELERSRYLIVICSQQSAKSEWVGKEISSFVEMGRADSIILFIIDGEPNSNDERECFHPIIKEKIPEALGININEIGKEQAFIKVCAKLLDLRFDNLWNRFLRAQRKQRIIAAAIGLLFLAGGGFLFDFLRVKKEYYADYVDRWGIPEGVIKLSGAQIKKRLNYYRFETSRGKLRRVVYANSAGFPVEHVKPEHADRSAIQELFFTGNRISVTVLKNSKNKTIVTYYWGGKNSDRIDIKQDLEGQTAAALASSFTSMQNLFIGFGYEKADIKRFKLTRNDDGYIVRKEFKRHNGDDSVPASDASGIWGFEYDLDELGRIVTSYYLGNDGQHFPNKTGIIKQKYEYDIHGNVSRTEYLDKEENLILNDELWAIRLNISDNNGNPFETTFFGIDNNPVLNNEDVWKYTYKFNEHGNLIEMANYGTEDNPVLNNIGVWKYNGKYDEHGNLIEYEIFGIDGNPVLNNSGVWKITRKFDKNGNEIEWANFGIDGNPVLNNNGVWKYTYKYDERGNWIEQTNFGIDGNPILDNTGVYKFAGKYDERGNMIEYANFGTDDNPVLTSSMRHPKWLPKFFVKEFFNRFMFLG